MLAEGKWMARLANEDFRALTPVNHSHVDPFNTFELDMRKAVAA